MFCVGLACCVGCGFNLWPSNVSFPAALGGGRYNYTVRESPFKRDLLREFVDAARAAGIRPGIYYIVNNNVLLERIYNATAAEKENIILGQLREIWSSYGELVELWFDGGTQDPVLGRFSFFQVPSLHTVKITLSVSASLPFFSVLHNRWVNRVECLLVLPSIAGSKIPPLLQELQPKAVCFQGPTKTQAVRWAGSESGHAILPNWCVWPITRSVVCAPHLLAVECLRADLLTWTDSVMDIQHHRQSGLHRKVQPTMEVARLLVPCLPQQRLTLHCQWMVAGTGDQASRSRR